MLTFFTILSVFTATALFFRLLPFLYETPAKQKENLFLQLSREGTANNLIFCSQEVLQNKVIGIDGIHRKIMVLEKIKNTYNCSIICLDDVQHCQLIKTCGTLDEDNFNKFQIANNLHAIELQFQFKNHTQPASIIFYDSLSNSKRELELLKAKAEFWSVMLSKMLTQKQQRISVRA